ncbi:helix-turn-helix transcriptional regulator [Verrucosispora sp. WMMC514]|uniref:helix-turn-helix domain-containing protein n=1 Tax=Verrucosispora sp. WMMC514 TaxID=3015156 RepID=UPI00248C13E8|nr:helix-turn-helix transcriptional regulator [Verrucosispora sp. WMMC514]WBB94259.1 helix-turn-helix transcriptional regulator [Verrucosispora sp. WMMC514]
MTGDLLRAFGQRVRILRAERGLTQQQLADAIGLTRTSVTNIEAGRQETLATTLVRLATALDVVPGALLDGLDGTAPAAMPWLELARAVTAAEREHRTRAESCWRAHDVMAAVRLRGIADGLARARDLHAEVVAATKGGDGRG